jgi:hypothetical protein
MVHLLDHHDVVFAVETVAPRAVLVRSYAVTLIPATQRRDRHTYSFRDHTDGVLRLVRAALEALAF